MTFITPQKWVAHLDRIAGWQAGRKPAPVTVEFDLSNRCYLGCQSCFPGSTIVVTPRGEVPIDQINPHDHVLGYDQSTGALTWTRVLVASERPYVGRVVDVTAQGTDEIIATSEHPFLTQRGWVKAHELTIADVLKRAESVRVRLRQSSEDAWLHTVPRPLQPGAAPLDQRRQETQQPDEAARGVAKGGRCAPRPEDPQVIRDAEADVRGRHTQATSYDGRVETASVGQNACEQPDATTGRCREVRVWREGEWTLRTNECVAPREVEGSRIQSAHVRAHAAAQSDEGSGHQGKEPRAYTATLEALTPRGVVCVPLRDIRVTDLVYRDRAILGERQESGLQDSRPDGRDRADRRLLANTDTPDDRELRHSNHHALQGEGRALSGGARSIQTGEENAEPGIGAHGCRGDVHSHAGDEWMLDDVPITGLSSRDALLTVYNLETETGTYVAGGVVVHNCHFAHTHTRGPWVAKDRRLPMAWAGTGDLADTAMVFRVLKDMADAGVKGIVFSGGGEPTTHPDWQGAITMASGLGLHVGMYTAGGLLTEDSAAHLAGRAQWVVVSLDTKDADTYALEKGVKPEFFNKACDGIRWLSAAKSAVVGVSFLLHRGNWIYADEMLALARSLGATYTTFRPTIETAPDHPASRLGDVNWVSGALPMLGRLALESDVECDPARFAAYRDWTGRSYDACHGIKLNSTVTPDGKVWVCLQRRGMSGSCIGDLSTESFADIWARHPGAWTDFAECRVMCRLHLLNESLAPVFQTRAHEAFV